MKTLLIAGKDISVLRALGDLVRSVLPQLDEGPLIILTANSEDEILRALCREKVDMLMVDDRLDVGHELIRWLNRSPFKMKKVLIGDSRQCATPVIDPQNGGIDASLARPVNKDDLKRILRELLSAG